ncbi:MAG: HIT family protein [Bacteroidales bacterium]|nr:HIT family protein [Bacteroidales bacterium]
MNKKELEEPLTLSCPFCREGISNVSFLESDYFRAIYNIAPIIRGHSLVISRRHIESVLDFTKEEQSEFLVFAAEVTRLLLKTFRGEGFDWSVQEGKVAGQSVPHFHMHIVIRRPGDLQADEDWYGKIVENEDILLDSNSRKKLSDEEYQFYTDFIKSEI